MTRWMEVCEVYDSEYVITGRNVFISGPMTGIEHYNAPAFARAHAVCWELGANLIYDPSWEWMSGSMREDSHALCMLRCINRLTHEVAPIHTLLQLPDWEKSDGCRLERDVALACGIKVVELEEVERRCADTTSS